MNEAITEYVPTLRERNIRLRILGDLSRFDSESRAGLESSVEALSGSTGMTLSVALSYGGRDEIVAAARQAAVEGDITAETLSAHLYTAGLPILNLIIRTSGELRISNFLLWQSAYSEYYFTSTLWPISDGRSFAVHCGITAPASAASDVRKKRLRLEIRLLEPESWQIQKWLRFVFFYGSGKRQTADIIRFPDKTVSNRFANCVKCRCLQIQMNL